MKHSTVNTDIINQATVNKSKLLNWLSSAPEELWAEELVKWIENQTNNEHRD